MTFMPSPRIRLRMLALAAIVAFSAACGSVTEPVPFATVEQTTFADSLHISLANFNKLPSGMYTRDSVAGTGVTIANGHTISTRYVGYLANGTVFDQGTFSFVLGAGNVIQGWDIGMQGMKVGGKRQLLIPPQLGYGLSQRGSIPPNSVLVFSVEVISTT